MQEKRIFGTLQNKLIKVSTYKNNTLDDEDIFIVLDGRYNEKEYIKKIKQLYIKFGEKFLFEIDDFFSIYLYDKKNNVLIISRDRMGSKTVYYSINNNNVFFGNDIMLIVDNYGIKKEINKKCLSMYFRNHYIEPPETIFNGIYKLKHGEYLLYKNNKLEIKQYWNEIEQFNSNSKKKITKKKEIKNELKNILEENIKEFLKTEKDIGIYLSGGIDSSLVAAICKKLSKKNFKTFSIGFYDKKCNEAEKSKKIAEYLETDHYELYIKNKDIKRIVKKIPKYYTEPFGDCSEFPTIVLNELARKNNIKIAITGDGADQLFCGCSIYDSEYKVQKVYKLLNPLNICFYFNNRKLQYIFENTNKNYQTQFDKIPYDHVLKSLFVDDGNKRFKQENSIKSKNWQEKRMILDIGTFMADRVSIKMGIASKKNNIDMRTPFFCKNVIEYTFKIPHKLKYHNRVKKYILKEILFDYIPRNLFNKKKKGFGIPTKKWLKEYFYEDLLRLSEKNFIEKQNIFNYDSLCKILNDIDNDISSSILWDFYMFQLWYDEYIV